MADTRVLIVDDERAARSRIRKLLREEPGVEVVAEASSGPEAVAAVERHAPDLLFLDVQMPGMDGFEVLRELLQRSGAAPAVVFVTAYDSYAIRAFEARAIDYLLKPFDDDRFREALAHARQRLRERSSDRLRARLRALLDETASGRGEGGVAPTDSTAMATVATGARRIPVRRHDRILLVEMDGVDWVEAAGDYVRLHVGERSYLVRSSLGELEAALGDGFARIHRSAIVRVDAIQELSPRTHGDYDVVLRDGVRLRLSRSYREAVARTLGLEL